VFAGIQAAVTHDCSVSLNKGEIYAKYMENTMAFMAENTYYGIFIMIIVIFGGFDSLLTNIKLYACLHLCSTETFLG